MRSFNKNSISLLAIAVVVFSVVFISSNTTSVRAAGNGTCTGESEAAGGGQYTEDIQCFVDVTFAGSYAGFSGSYGVTATHMKLAATQACIAAGYPGFASWDAGNPVLRTNPATGNFTCQPMVAVGPMYDDIGLRVNQGTAGAPDIQHIAIEQAVGAGSRIMIAKSSIAYQVALVDPGDANATKVLFKMPDGSVKALRACTAVAANQCNYVP